MQEPPQMPTAPPAVPAKKGLPTAAWIGIGCLGIILLGGAILVIGGMFVWNSFSAVLENPEKTAAHMMVEANPEWTKISENEEKGEMTIRVNNGDELTLSYEDISEGRFTFPDVEGGETVSGSPDLSLVPAWVPRPADLTEGLVTYHSTTGKEITGQFSGRSSMSAEDLKAFFEGEASSLDMGSRSQKSTSSANVTVMNLKYSGSGKSLVVVITEKAGEASRVNLAYSESP